MVLLDGAIAPSLPAGVTVRASPSELDYPGLLDLIFEATSVITW